MVMHHNDGMGPRCRSQLCKPREGAQARVERALQKAQRRFSAHFGIHNEDVNLGLAIAQKRHHAPGDVFRRSETGHLLPAGLGPAPDPNALAPSALRALSLLAHELAGVRVLIVLGCAPDVAARARSSAVTHHSPSAG
jgi:hypothetical protein